MEAHILVVDDDAAIRELIREYLAENDFKVSVAETGADMIACRRGSRTWDSRPQAARRGWPCHRASAARIARPAHHASPVAGRGGTA